MAQRFSSYEEALQYITDYEQQTVSKLVIYKKTKHVNNTRLDSPNFKVLWEERQGALPIPFDGVPFVIVGKEDRECQHGPNRKKGKSVEDRTNDDHRYGGKKKRRLLQDTKKMDCPIKLKMRMIIRFPGYAMDGADSAHRRRKCSEKLKSEFDLSTQQEYCVLLKFIGQHENHETGELAGYGLPLEASTKQKIKDLVLVNGLTNIEEIKKQVEAFSKEQHPEVPVSNRQYFPTMQDVRNHVSLALNNGRFSKDDQENVQGLVSSWREKNPQDSYYYRMASCSPDNGVQSLLFVHQTHFQQQMLKKYGKDVVLMDSTYKTSKYELPLFFVCVLTNVGYMVVASFLIGRESRVHISEGLRVIKEWNNRWMPKSFMVDMDQREIGAIEDVFKEASVFLCEFHREQAWERWFARKENGGQACKEETIQYLRQIARSKTESELNEHIQALRETNIYCTNSRFSTYIERQWIVNKERWVRCFRTSHMNLKVNTTNGVEIQNRLFKEKYLHGKGSSKTLTNVLSVLTQTFVPDSRERYIRENVVARSSSRKYSKEVPLFLRDRPQRFVKYCMERINTGDVLSYEEIDQGFRVQGQSGNVYCIDFDQPSCSCPDFQKFCWPCKHLLGVMAQFPAYGWDFLPAEYKEIPLFNIDLDPDNSTSTENDQVPMDSSDSTEVNSTKCTRSYLVELMKELLNDVYIVDEETISEVKVHILAALDVMKKKQSMDLPVRPTRKRKRRPFSVPVKQSGTRKEEDLNVFDDILKPPSPEIFIDVRTTEPEVFANWVSPCLPDYLNLEDLQDTQTEIKKIWNKGLEVDNKMIGPYTLDTESFRCIKSFLSDEVIDCFLHEMVQQHQNEGVYHLNCITMTSVFEGHKQIHHCLRRMPSLMRYHTIVGAYNQDRCHWCLIIIRPADRQILFLNPLGTVEIQRQDIVLKWYNFLKLRHEEGLESELAENWDLKIPSHAKQQDGSSCGIYVLKFAENFLSGQPLQFAWEREQVEEARMSLAVFLLSVSSMHRNNETSQTIRESGQSVESPDCVNLEAEESILTEDMGAEDNVLPSCSTTKSPSLEKDTPLESEEQENHSPRPENILREDTSPLKETPEKKVKKTSVRGLKPKRKMSSFIYPSLKKEPKVYCKCRQPYNGSFMILCDICGEWYHPACIGVERSDLPEAENNFFCPDCSLFVIPDVLKESSDENEDNSDDDYFINMNTVYQHLPAVLTRIHDIVTTNKDDVSNKAWVKRHKLFCSGKLDEQHGYGFAVFSQQAILCAGQFVKQKFLKTHFRGAYLRAEYIAALTDKRLRKAFEDNIFLATVYCEKVLCKEALCALFQDVTGAEYDIAEQECSGIQDKSLLKAIKDGFKICLQKKEELREKFSS